MQEHAGQAGMRLRKTKAFRRMENAESWKFNESERRCSLGFLNEKDVAELGKSLPSEDEEENKQQEVIIRQKNKKTVQVRSQKRNACAWRTHQQLEAYKISQVKTPHEASALNALKPLTNEQSFVKKWLA